MLSAGCQTAEEDTSNSNITKYELLDGHYILNKYWLKQFIIDYFIDVAIGSEYGAGFPLTKKWNTKMMIYVEGEMHEELSSELDKVIEELNSLFEDGFEIQITEDKSLSNFIIFLGHGDDYAKLFPGIRDYVDDNYGLAWIYTDNHHHITHGHMYVDIERADLQSQLHLLREELTQSLGLTNDIPHFPNSLFYDKHSEINAYSVMDREIIRLLYHPKVVAGIGKESVNFLLTDLLNF